MNLHWSLAAAAGLLGAVVMTLLLWLCRMLGVTAYDPSLDLGSIFTEDTSTSAWALGFVARILIGVFVAFAYAEVFEAWAGATWRRGLLLAIPHALIAGLALLTLPSLHPLMPGDLAAPGFMALNHGWITVIVFILMHLAYGAIVGGLYEVRPEHALRRPLSRSLHAARTE
jgi:hypothetical protein